MNEEPIKGVYITALELHNVKCFAGPVKIDFTDGEGKWAKWSVIIGQNAVGKTTVLRAVAGLSPSVPGFVGKLFAAPHLNKRPGQEDHREKYCRIGATNAILEGRFFFEPNEHSYSVKLRIGQDGQYYNEDKELLEYKQFTCLGYGASRKMGSTDQGENRLADASATLFDDEALLANAEEIIIRIDYSAEKDKTDKSRRQRERIQDILINILPDVDDLKIVHRESDFGSEVHFHTPDGWVRLKDMSLGYKTLISWVVDLASKMFIIYRDQEKPLEQPAIVLVDEIDLHMHPRWQRDIMDYLANIFTRTQFIVTAHSPLIVQAASDANLILLRRNPETKEVEVENDPLIVKNWRIDQILASDLFGVSPHPRRVEELLKRRRELLTKTKKTRSDSAELAKLEEEIGPLPVGETEEEIQAMELILRAARDLK